jgi:cytochrome c oxidase cbb3-type subunit IV
MRYVKHFFENIAGIEIYPMISLLIFFFFFLALGFYVLKMRKSHVQYMAASPLDLDRQQEEEQYAPQAPQS